MNMRRMVYAAVLMLLPVSAWAQEGGTAMQAHTWQSLGTMAGATAATLMIVQLFKAPLDRIWKIPTRLVVYLTALVLMLTAQHFSGGLNMENVLLAAVNAVMVALSAYGTYELTFAKKEAK